MDDSQHWRVEPVPGAGFATGGPVPAPGGLVVMFGCELLMPKRLTEIIGDPFDEG